VLPADGLSCRTPYILRVSSSTGSPAVYTISAADTSGLQCGTDINPLSKPGRWFTFVAPYNGTFTMHSCYRSSFATDFDHELYFYTLRPNATTSICDDPTSASSCTYTDDSTQGLCSAKVFSAQEGQTFYGFLAARSATALNACLGQVNTCAFPMSVVAGALYVYAPSVPPFTISACSISYDEIYLERTADGDFSSSNSRYATVGSLLGPERYCGMTNMTRGVWFRHMITTSRTHYFSTCFAETTVPTRIYVFTGFSCGFQQCVSNADSSRCSDGNTNGMVVSTSSGSTANDYYIFVEKLLSDDSATGGKFRLGAKTDVSGSSSDSGLALGLGLGLPMSFFFVIFIIIFICFVRRAKRNGMLSMIAQRNGLFGANTRPRDDVVVVAYNNNPPTNAVQMATYSPS
jgi:hypothetical protein